MKSNPPEKPTVIFAGTAQFAVPSLEKLIKVADIVLVITQPAKPAGRGLVETACPVDSFAQEHDLPVFRPASLKRDAIEATLREYPCDYLIVAAYGKIIPQWLLDFPAYRSLNIHGSLLPRWRGASPIQHALLSGDTQTGVNLMTMKLGLDEGPVLLSKSIDIQPTDTQETLVHSLGKIGAELIAQFFQNPKIKATHQEGEVTYAPKIVKSMGQVLWSEQSATQISNAFRAFHPWPGLFTWTPELLRIKILSIGSIQAEQEGDQSIMPGTIKIENGHFFVQTKKNWIEITEFQLEGKNKSCGAEALNDMNHWSRTLTHFITQEASPCSK